jgi:hypothetical protein
MIAWQILMGLRSTSRQSAEDNMDRMEVCLLPNILTSPAALGGTFRTWGDISLNCSREYFSARWFRNDTRRFFADSNDLSRKLRRSITEGHSEFRNLGRSFISLGALLTP